MQANACSAAGAQGAAAQPSIQAPSAQQPPSPLHLLCLRPTCTSRPTDPTPPPRLVYWLQSNNSRDAKYALKASYLEIYNEGVFDLVNFTPKQRTSLPVKFDPTHGFYVQVWRSTRSCCCALSWQPPGRAHTVASGPCSHGLRWARVRALQGLRVVPCSQERTMMEVRQVPAGSLQIPCMEWQLLRARACMQHAAGRERGAEC